MAQRPPRAGVLGGSPNPGKFGLDSILDAFAQQMGLEEAARASAPVKRQTLADRFASQRYLLLLDNLEDADDPVELVRQLLALASTSRLLITMHDKRLSQLDLVQQHDETAV